MVQCFQASSANYSQSASKIGITVQLDPHLSNEYYKVFEALKHWSRILNSMSLESCISETQIRNNLSFVLLVVLPLVPPKLRSETPQVRARLNA
eukprot:s675_g11.t1